MKKSFTLIELLVAVTIFVVVCVVVMVVLSIAVSSKSKIKAMNELRTEGGKIMSLIQTMVETGNGTDALGFFINGVVIIDSNGVGVPQTACGTDVTGAGIASFSTDSKNWRIHQLMRFDNNQIQLLKRIYDNNENPFPAAPPSWVNITPANIRINSASFSGTYRDACPITKINVSIELQGQTTGYSGPPPTIRLTSTFTSHYPGPDLAGDSVPPAY